jgi:hypothetical protein
MYGTAFSRVSGLRPKLATEMVACSLCAKRQTGQKQRRKTLMRFFIMLYPFVKCVNFPVREGGIVADFSGEVKYCFSNLNQHSVTAKQITKVSPVGAPTGRVSN